MELQDGFNLCDEKKIVAFSKQLRLSAFLPVSQLLIAQFLELNAT